MDTESDQLDERTVPSDAQKEMLINLLGKLAVSRDLGDTLQRCRFHYGLWSAIAKKVNSVGAAKKCAKKWQLFWYHWIRNTKVKYKRLSKAKYRKTPPKKQRKGKKRVFQLSYLEYEALAVSQKVAAPPNAAAPSWTEIVNVENVPQRNDYFRKGPFIYRHEPDFNLEAFKEQMADLNADVNLQYV